MQSSTIKLFGDSLLKNVTSFKIDDLTVYTQSFPGANVSKMRSEIIYLDNTNVDLAILVGTNEVFRTRRIDNSVEQPEQMFGDGNMVVNRIANFAKEVRSIFTGNIHFLAIPPRGRQRSIAYVGELNKYLKNRFLFEKIKNLYFADLNFDDFIGKNGEIVKNFYSRDYLHLSPSGSEKIQEKIKDYFRRFYDRPAPGHTNLTHLMIDTDLDETAPQSPTATPSPATDVPRNRSKSMADNFSHRNAATPARSPHPSTTQPNTQRPDSETSNPARVRTRSNPRPQTSSSVPKASQKTSYKDTRPIPTSNPKPKTSTTPTDAPTSAAGAFLASAGVTPMTSQNDPTDQVDTDSSAKKAGSTPPNSSLEASPQ